MRAHQGSRLKPVVKFCWSFFVMFVIGFKSHGASAEVVVIANGEQNEALTKDSIYNLYMGVEKNNRIELLNQREGQLARTEFFEKFLRQNEAQMKKKWSVLVFSGNRVPVNMADDQAVFEYVKIHPMAVGYVSEGFVGKNAAILNVEGQPVVLFKIK